MLGVAHRLYRPGRAARRHQHVRCVLAPGRDRRERTAGRIGEAIEPGAVEGPEKDESRNARSPLERRVLEEERGPLEPGLPWGTFPLGRVGGGT
ncbi:MAG: hypothetical protein M0010_21920 [Actinomycetota bacterium]|nr:hypothetical protein [Actinomycetota bacterium]